MHITNSPVVVTLRRHVNLKLFRHLPAGGYLRGGIFQTAQSASHDQLTEYA
jgi:hypothetical protein